MTSGIYIRTEEMKQNISKASARYWAGKKLPQEVKKKLSNSAKKRGIRSPMEDLEKKSKRMKGNIYGFKKGKSPWNKEKTLNNWKQERIKLFNSYDWDLLFFDETQVNEEQVINLLKGGW